MSPEEELQSIISEKKSTLRSRDTLKPLLAGAAQGVGFDFADEAYGGIRAATSDDTYEQARDDARQWFDKQREENPSAYMAGDVGGSIATSFIPGLGAAKGGKIASLILKNMGKSAALGGLQAAGASEGESVGDVAKDALTGAAIGGGLSLGGDVAAAGLRKVGKGANFIKEKILNKMGSGGERGGEKALYNVATGLEPAQYDAIVSNPNIIKEAESDSMKKIADDFVETRYKPLRELGNRRYEQAVQRLRSEPSAEFGAVKKEALVQELEDLANQKEFNLGQAGIKSIQEVKDEINRVFPKSDDYIPETAIEKLKNEVSAKVRNWNSLTGDKGEQDMLKNIRGILNEKVKQNPEFDTAMQPVREVADALNMVKKNYGLERKSNDLGESFIAPTKTTLDRLQQVRQSLSDKNYREEELSGVENLYQKLREENNPEFADILSRVTGNSPTERVRAKQLWEATEAGAPQGSAQTNMYADIGRGIAGAALGGVAAEDPVTGLALGGGIGAGLGRFSDKYGRKLAKNTLLKKYGRLAAPAGHLDAAQEKLANSKYGDLLETAMRRGPQAYAVTDYILSQKEPEYRKTKAGEY
jgi:hypothetical protein